MPNIFITGGAGFIGSHLAEELAHHGNNITIYDNLLTGRLDNLSEIPHTFIQGDIRNLDLLVEALQDCDIVFHLAALTSVTESMANMDEYLAVNLMGTINVLKAAKANKVKKLILASSAAVYGDSDELPKEENMKLAPKSPYAITKIDGEYYCGLFNDFYGLPTVCARFFNVFGERQAEDSPYSAAIPIFISKMLRNETISIYGDGTQTRDLVYVKNVVRALILLMGQGTGVYNIGSGQIIDINSLVHKIFQILNSHPAVRYIPERPGEIKHSYASIEKLTALGFQPDFSLEEGLTRTIGYYREKYKTSLVEKMINNL
jgi:UDP-glucose 4-epimerase